MILRHIFDGRSIDGREDFFFNISVNTFKVDMILPGYEIWFQRYRINNAKAHYCVIGEISFLAFWETYYIHMRKTNTSNFTIDMHHKIITDILRDNRPTIHNDNEV